MHKKKNLSFKMIISNNVFNDYFITKEELLKLLKEVEPKMTVESVDDYYEMITGRVNIKVSISSLDDGYQIKILSGKLSGTTEVIKYEHLDKNKTLIMWDCIYSSQSFVSLFLFKLTTKIGMNKIKKFLESKSIKY